MLLQHLFDIHSLAAKHAGCTSQCDISLVSGVHHVGGFAALCNDQLRILTYSRRNRRGVPVEPEQVARVGYLSPEVMVVDGTHIKANANLEKHMKKAIPGMAKRYQEQLGN